MISIIYFLAVTFLLGAFLSKRIHLINMGYGLALFTIIATIFKAPVYWWLFLILGICLFLIQVVRKKVDFKIQKPQIWIILVLLLTGAFFLAYHQGAFSYPWLEDGDPWHHAMGAFYVAEEHTYSIPYYPETYARRVYLEPYPPSYDILMATLYQLNGDMYWTFKFFNVLLISLGLIFAFYMMKRLFKSEKYAFLVTVGLAMIPCFMSHFIWAQTLAVILMFPAIYALHKREYLAATLCMAAIIITQPSTAFIFGAFFFLPYLFIRRKAMILVSGAAAGLFSLGYYIPTIMKFGWQDFTKGMGWVSGFSTTLLESGSFGVKYGLMDFIIPSTRTMIDQPIGVGIFLILSFFVSLFFLFDFYKRNKYLPKVFKLSLLWFILTFLGTIGNYFPINFVPHRFWVFFAIPFVMLAVYSIHKFTDILPKLKWPIIIVFILMTFWTSGYIKYQTQNLKWGPGSSFGPEHPDPQVNMMLYQEEINGYLALNQNVPKGSSIMELCWDEEKIITYGYYAPPLDEEIMRFRNNLTEHSAQDIYNLAKKKNMEYVLLTGTCLRNADMDMLNKLLEDITSSKLFGPVYNTQSFFLLRVI